ncbi:MAG: hypothetical protein WBC22_19200 [Sedimentisphaerales bacterium]
MVLIEGSFPHELEIDRGNPLHDRQEAPVLANAFPDRLDLSFGDIVLPLNSVSRDAEIPARAVAFARMTATGGPRAGGEALKERPADQQHQAWQLLQELGPLPAQHPHPALPRWSHAACIAYKSMLYKRKTPPPEAET